VVVFDNRGVGASTGNLLSRLNKWQMMQLLLFKQKVSTS
jgi:hypothetical protein